MLKQLLGNKRGVAGVAADASSGLYSATLAIVVIALINYFIPLSQYAPGLALGKLGQVLFTGIIAALAYSSLEKSVFGGEIKWLPLAITVVVTFGAGYLVWFTWPKVAPLGLFDPQSFVSLKLGVQSMIGVLP